MNYVNSICQLFPQDIHDRRNRNLTLSNYSHFSKCQEQIMFTWLPCVVFGFLAPSWVHMLQRKKFAQTKISILLISKNVNNMNL
jgi:hypothetical protein